MPARPVTHTPDINISKSDLIAKVRDAIEHADTARYEIIDPTPNYEAMAEEVVELFLRNGLVPGSITTHNNTTSL